MVMAFTGKEPTSSKERSSPSVMFILLLNAMKRNMFLLGYELNLKE